MASMPQDRRGPRAIVVGPRQDPVPRERPAKAVDLHDLLDGPLHRHRPRRSIRRRLASGALLAVAAWLATLGGFSAVARALIG